MNATADTTGEIHRLVLGARRLGWRIARTGRRLIGRKRTVYVDERVDEYGAYWAQAARALGATFELLYPGVWEIRRGTQRTRIANDWVQIDDPVTLHIAGNKAYCCEVASRLGIPVAPHRLFRLGEIGLARRFMREQGGGVVVKPVSGSSSALGVTMDVHSPRQLESAAALASLYSRQIMVEAMVPAESCRLLYLDGELIHAVRRRGARLVGDGNASIRELLVRGGLANLRSDALTHRTLEAQGLSLASRPGPGAEIVVRCLPAEEPLMPELRTVYNECITDLVCPQIAHSIAALVREIGSRFAGVDILTNDPAVPLATRSGVFLEINTTPAIHHHYVRRDDPPVAVRVLSYLLDRNRA